MRTGRNSTVQLRPTTPDSPPPPPPTWVSQPGRASSATTSPAGKSAKGRAILMTRGYAAGSTRSTPLTYCLMPPPQPEGDPGVVIRPATADDLGDINDIYNHYVLHSSATYQEAPEPIEGRRAWFARHGPSHPVTVAEVGGRVVGWGSLSPFHARSAYRNTVENSVY